jgi:hypothetical protein
VFSGAFILINPFQHAGYFRDTTLRNPDTHPGSSTSHCHFEYSGIVRECG